MQIHMKETKCLPVPYSYMCFSTGQYLVPQVLTIIQ